MIQRTLLNMYTTMQKCLVKDAIAQSDQKQIHLRTLKNGIVSDLEKNNKQNRLKLSMVRYS